MSRPHSWVGPATRDPGTVTGPTRPTALHEAYGRQLTEMLVKVPDNLADELAAAASVDRTVGLPIGTRVRKLGSRRFGTVMPHQPEYSRGSFPVRFDDQIWEVLDVSYVTAVAQEATATVTALHRRSTRTRPRAAS